MCWHKISEFSKLHIRLFLYYTFLYSISVRKYPPWIFLCEEKKMVLSEHHFFFCVSHTNAYVWETLRGYNFWQKHQNWKVIAAMKIPWLVLFNNNIKYSILCKFKIILFYCSCSNRDNHPASSLKIGPSAHEVCMYICM